MSTTNISNIKIIILIQEMTIALDKIIGLSGHGFNGGTHSVILAP